MSLIVCDVDSTTSSNDTKSEQVCVAIRGGCDVADALVEVVWARSKLCCVVVGIEI